MDNSWSWQKLQGTSNVAMNAGANRISILALIPMLFLMSINPAKAEFDVAAELYRQKNYPAALEAFSTLAGKGDPRAQTILGLMYKYGEGTQQDLNQSFEWYLTAAELGHPPAQFHTGFMYAEGLGVAQDKEKAVNWLKLAAEQGFDRAVDMLYQLNAEYAEEKRAARALEPWSTNWNFRLPNSVRLAGSESNPAATIDLDESYRIQLGAMQTRESIRRLWDLLRHTHPDLFADLEPLFALSDNPDRRVYRLQIGPFSHTEALRFCEILLNRTVQAGCLPVKPN
jgi:hypothetical protein